MSTPTLTVDVAALFNPLWVAALTQVLQHGETGCPHAASHAACLLERLANQPGLDNATRDLCERASQRLIDRPAHR